VPYRDLIALLRRAIFILPRKHRSLFRSVFIGAFSFPESNQSNCVFVDSRKSAARYVRILKPWFRATLTFFKIILF